MASQVATTQIERQVSRIPSRQLAAIFVWSGAVWTTGEFIRVLNPDLSGFVLYLLAIGVQAVMTHIESDIWSGKFRFLPFVVLVVDIFINAGGIWEWITLIDKTPVWTMLADLGAPAEMSIIAKISFAIGGGTILAAAPEQIWSTK